MSIGNWWTRFVRRKLKLDATPAPAAPPIPPRVAPRKPFKPVVPPKPTPTVHEHRTYSDPVTDMAIMGAILSASYDDTTSSCDTSSYDGGSSCSSGD